MPAHRDVTFFFGAIVLFVEEFLEIDSWQTTCGIISVVRTRFREN